jgi:hypothetical protein
MAADGHLQHVVVYSEAGLMVPVAISRNLRGGCLREPHLRLAIFFRAIFQLLYLRGETAE